MISRLSTVDLVLRGGSNKDFKGFSLTATRLPLCLSSTQVIITSPKLSALVNYVSHCTLGSALPRNDRLDDLYALVRSDFSRQT